VQYAVGAAEEVARIEPELVVVAHVANLRGAEEVADRGDLARHLAALARRQLGQPLGQVHDAEPDVARLVALHVGQKLRQDRLDVGLGQEAEDRLRRALGQELHGEQLDRQVAILEQRAQGQREVLVERRRWHVQKSQVVAQGVEVAGLVEHLAGGGHPRIGVVEALGQLGRHDPGAQLAPHQHADRIGQGDLPIAVELDAAVARDSVAKQGRAVPGIARGVGVDAAQAARLLLRQRQRLVEDQRLRWPGAEPAQARAQREPQRSGRGLGQVADDAGVHRPSPYQPVGWASRRDMATAPHEPRFSRHRMRVRRGPALAHVAGVI
jgi:hypothetical protein